MNDPKVKPPDNMTRVLVETKIGPLSFAYYKDGMFKYDGSRDWTHPEAIRSWISISDLKEKLLI